MKKLSLEQKRRNELIAERSFKHNIKRKSKLKKQSFHSYKQDLYYSSDVEKFCKKNNISSWGKRVQQAIRFDEKINLFDNPDKLIKLLLEVLFNAKFHNTYPEVIFSGRIKFGALYLMDNMCWEVARKREWKIHFQNLHNEDHAILSNLRSFFSSQFENEKVYLLNEKVNINRSNNLLAKQQYKAKSKEITDLVIQGVKENSNPDFNLEPEAYQAISSTIGEHFDNILLHAPKSEFGYLCGFYDKIGKEVHILIYNFGSTIADTLSSATLPKEVAKEIDSVIESHTKSNVFRMFSNTFTKENALTVLSLQEGISSRLEYDKSRGHGITDFIEHCFNLNIETKISLISGNTAIKIDKKYTIEKKFFIDRERRVISFNKNNDLFSRPDEEYVKNMKVFFPGLIIETIIPLII